MVAMMMPQLLPIFVVTCLLLCSNSLAHEDELVLQRTELDAKLPKSISDHTASLGSDDLIYIAGGCDNPDGNVFSDEGNNSFFYCPSVSSSFYSFDPTTGQIIDLPDLPRQRYRHAAVAIQNHIFFVGGRNAMDELIPEADVFDITTKDWSTVTLPEGYATSDLSGWGTETNAYFVGGYNQTYTALANVFSIDVSKFAETGELVIKDHKPMIFPRGDIGATVNLDTGYAYVSGGFSHENDFCAPLSSVERYSLLGDTWIDVADLPTARADTVMVNYNGHTLVMGGETQVENKCELDKHLPAELTIAVDDIEIMEEDDTSWEQLDPLPEHRFRFAAVVFKDTIYTFGGQQGYNETCNCLKTTNEVVSYVDESISSVGEQPQEEGENQEPDVTPDAGASPPSGAAPFLTVLVSFMLVLLISIGN